jgi:hypothetical protein
VPPIPPVPESYYHRIPTGAIWLIALGLFFLVGNIHMFSFFHGFVTGPVILIAVGVWLFVRKMMSTGPGLENDGTPLYGWRLSSALSGSIWVIVTGFLWLLADLHILSWAHSWPIYVIAAGVIMLLRRTLESGGYGYVPPPAAPMTPTPPVAPVTSTEIVPATPESHDLTNHDQEGR